MRAADLHRRSLLKLARRAGALALGVVGATALLVGALWTFLQTGWGGRVALRIALPRVNAAIAGRLTVEQLAFGGHWLVLDRIALADPDGRLVARVGRIELDFSPWALVRRRLAIGRLDVERPELQLVTDARGSNLGRALAARHPTPVAPPSAPAGGFSVDIDALSIAGGRLDAHGADPNGRRVHLRALAASGSAAYDGHRRLVTVDLAAEADGGRVRARGTVDLAGQRTLGDGLSIEVAHLDLGRLASQMPRSDLAFSLRARGGGGDLASLDGALDFTAPPNRLDDHTLGPIRLSVRAVRGRYELATLQASLPGIALDGSGHATPEALDLRARLTATDLGATVHSLAPPGGPPPLALAGRGRIDLAITGPPGAPSVQLAASAPWLRFGNTEVERLSVAAAVLDGRLTAEASVAAPYPVFVAAGGGWRPEKRQLALDRFEVRYPEATWRLAHRARLSLADGRFAINGFDLRAGGQAIDVDLGKTPSSLRGRLQLSHLDLGRLPRVLVPPALGLGGTVELRARLDGTPTSPRIDAQASLAGGRLRNYHDLALDLRVRVAGRRAEGHLHARGLGTSLAADFDLPASWPVHDRRAPLRLELALGRTDLAALAKTVAQATGSPAAPVAGTASLEARLDGTVGRPKLSLSAHAGGLALGGRRIGNLELGARNPTERDLSGELALDEPHSGAAARVRFRLGLDLAQILTRPPDAVALERASLALDGDVDRLPLAMLATLAGYRPPVAGTLAARFSFSGTARAPSGKLGADVSGAASGRFPPTDARLEADLDPEAVALRVRVTRQGHPLLAAEGRIGAPLGRLAEPERLGAAPIRLAAVLGPFEIERLGLPPQTDRDPPRAIAGLAHADLTVDGSLGAPRVEAHVQVADIRLDRKPVGYAQLSARYEHRHATVDLRAGSLNGGSLSLTAATTVDLGYPSVTRGLDSRRLPIDARFDARAFELIGFCGVTPEVRTIAGLVSAGVTVHGTLADPRIAGRLEWSHGQLGLTDVGDFHDLHLALHGDQNRLVLDEVAAKSGGGSLRVTGTGQRAAGPGYAVEARADLKQLPLYQDGQPIAALTLGASIRGTASPFDTRLTVDVQDARVALSDAKRKDLQPLAAPGDVVLMDGSHPLNRAQAEKLGAARAAANRLARPAAAVSPAAAKPEHERAAAVTRIAVDAPRKIWITGKDAYFELGLEPGFQVTIGATTRIVGTVEVKRGRVNVLGRRFDLKAGSTVEFDGLPDYPTLDVSAQYEDETDGITVVLTAQGRVDHLKIAVTAQNRPDLGESQLYALIVTGHLDQGGAGSGSFTASSAAASLLGGVIASKLQSTLAKRLPVDVLTIDSGGGEGLTGTQLEAGRYVTNKLYVGYVGRIGADPTRYQNHNAVHVEYQLSARWGIDGEYGDVGTGSADLIWKKNY